MSVVGVDLMSNKEEVDKKLLDEIKKDLENVDSKEKKSKDKKYMDTEEYSIDVEIDDADSALEKDFFG